jgi:hypothetical protein
MPLAELIDQYAAGPGLIRQAVAGMTRPQLLARPIEGKWSTLEVVAHLADFENDGVDRMAAVIAEHEPAIPGRDERNYAARLAYHERDLAEQIALIESCRGHLTGVLRTLSEADLSRRGIHSDAGPLTLSQLLERAIRHVAHHVTFIHAKRQALGLG